MSKVNLKITTNFDEASKQIGNLGTLTEQETKRIEKGLNKLEKFSTDSFVQQNKRAAIAITATQGATAGLEAEQRGLQRKIEMLVRNGINPESESLQKLQREFSDTTNKIEANARATKMQQDIVKNAGRAFLALGAAVGAVSFAGVKRWNEYSKEISNINTLLDISNDEFKTLDSTLIGMSTTFAIQKKELAGGIYQAVSAGAGNLADALEIVETSAKLGKGALIETSTAVDIITTAINAYGLGSDQASSVADDFFTIIKQGKIDGEQLSGSIGKSISLFAAAKIPLKSLGAGMATLTKVGVEASETTTQLNGIVSAFIKPSNAMREELKKVGYESGSAFLEAKGLAGALEFISTSGDGTLDSMSELVPNIRGLRGALAGASKDGMVFSEIMGEFEKNAGAADEALAKQTEGFAKEAFTMEQSIIVMDNFVQIIGQKLVPSIAGVLDPINEFLSDSEKMDEVINTVIPSVIALGGAFGVLAGMSVVNTGVKTFSTTMTGVKMVVPKVTAAMKLLNITLGLNPFTAVVMGGLTAIGIFSRLADRISDAADASATFAGSGVNETIDVLNKLKALNKRQRVYGNETENTKKLVKALGKQVGAKVAYNKVTKQYEILSAGLTQTVETLTQKQKGQLAGEKRIADQRKAEHAATLAKAEEARKIADDKEKADARREQATLQRNLRLEQAKQESERKQLEAVRVAEAERAEIARVQIEREQGAADLIRQINEEYTMSLLSDEEQKAEIINGKYDERIEKLRGFYDVNNEVFSELETLRNSELASIETAHQSKLDMIAEETEAIIGRDSFARKSVNNAQNIAENIAGIQKNAGKDNRAMLIAAKAMAIAEIGMKTSVAVTKTLADGGPYPLNIINAGLVGASGATQAIKVASTPIPSAETGIDNFVVPDSPTMRVDSVGLKVSPGEEVSVSPRGESSSRSLTVNAILDKEVLWSVSQEGFDSGVLTVNNDNLVGA